jgi:hypothetical protein
MTKLLLLLRNGNNSANKVNLKSRFHLIDFGASIHVPLDPLQVGSQAYPMGFANKSRKKRGAITDSTHTRIVCTATTDSLDRGPSGLRVGPSTIAKNDTQHMPLLLVEADEPKAYALSAHFEKQYIS